jgi:solute carrier family 25 phosphate transporter 23/24/25/41
MSLLCGGAAGLISSTATFPLDLIRRRMQLEGQAGTRKYKGYTDVARSVMASGGLRGFYAGILPEYYKVILESANIAYCLSSGRRISPGFATDAALVGIMCIAQSLPQSPQIQVLLWL